MSKPASMFSSFTLNTKELSRSGITGIRAFFGVSGAAALIIGIIMAFWPKDAAMAFTVLLAIYLLISGIAYVGISIFARNISGGTRSINSILGVLCIIASILAFANVAAATAFLAVFLGVLVGIIWIIEGIVALVQLDNSPSRGWTIFFGVLSIIAGISLVFLPLWGAIILFLFASISLIILGIFQIVRAFTFGRGVT